MRVTVPHEGRLQLRIDPQTDGCRGWRTPPAWRALAEACERLAAY